MFSLSKRYSGIWARVIPAGPDRVGNVSYAYLTVDPQVHNTSLYTAVLLSNILLKPLEKTILNMIWRCTFGIPRGDKMESCEKAK